MIGLKLVPCVLWDFEWFTKTPIARKKNAKSKKDCSSSSAN